VEYEQYAPGRPGIPPRWTSSAKAGVGTTLSHNTRVWLTLSRGIFNEVHYPRVDQACIRDLGLIVTDGQVFFSEEKRHAHSVVTTLADGVPAYPIGEYLQARAYRIEKEIAADPLRNVVLQRPSFVLRQGVLEDYHLYVLLAPHLGNRGNNNTAWVGDYKGVSVLFAERGGDVQLAAIGTFDTPNSLRLKAFRRLGSVKCSTS
jgi:glucoamylase